MINVTLAALVCLVGLLLYLCTTQRASEVGRIMFFCGLFVFLLQGGPKIAAFFGG